MMTSINKLSNKIKNKYMIYKINEVNTLVCIVNLFFYLLLLAIFPLENNFYSKIRHDFHYYYPQIRVQRPRLFDPLRFVIQTIFLLLFIQKPLRKKTATITTLKKWIQTHFKKYISAPAINKTKLATNLFKKTITQSKTPRFLSEKKRGFIGILIIIGSLLLAFLCITQPLDLTYQFTFVAIMWILALLLKSVHNRISLMLLIFISLLISSRYIWWRITKTIIVEDFTTSICSITLLLAELYSFTVMVLSYFQICWVLDRKPYPLPEDENSWPSVDIMIPTYNEPLDVVKPCLLAALDLNWPKDKLHIHLLDDGSRPEFENYAKNIGINYIKREEHNHAKAGNINNALTLTNGELVAIFDCDHIPTRAFLQMTVGWMVHDKNIALVQTPHHFYSDDPFEKNLNIKGKVPSENSLFHDFIQKGNDMWNATMFCGSCAVIRRAPLLEVGGIAIETVTEDAHTSLRLNRHGYSSAFISLPLAAGLATESLADHINQRIRWARGMTQIFRTDNPFLHRGLTFAQRICFANAMIHFLHGLPRIIFLLAPLPYLFFNVYVIFASGIAILSYVLPHMVHSTITNQRIQEGRRFYFWGAIYETILSWYITIPTIVALISPKHGKFNVTAKGEENDHTYFDWTVSRSYIILMILNFAGLVYGFYSLLFKPNAESITIAINMLWVVYNLLILGASTAVALEAKQVRTAPRVTCNIPTIIELSDGSMLSATINNFSKKGVGLTLPSLDKRKNWNDNLVIDSLLYLNIRQDEINYRFKFQVKRLFERQLGVEMILQNLQENIEFIRCTFARANRWVETNNDLKEDSIMNGAQMLIRIGFKGYIKMLDNTPFIFRWLFSITLRCTIFFFSLLPHPMDNRITKKVNKNK